MKDPDNGTVEGAKDYLDKVSKTFTRTRETDLRRNGFWAGWLSNAARYGDDPTLILDLDGIRNRITAKNVSAAAKRFLDNGSVFQAVLLPEK